MEMLSDGAGVLSVAVGCFTSSCLTDKHADSSPPHAAVLRIGGRLDLLRSDGSECGVGFVGATAQHVVAVQTGQAGTADVLCILSACGRVSLYAAEAVAAAAAAADPAAAAAGPPQPPRLTLAEACTAARLSVHGVDCAEAEGDFLTRLHLIAPAVFAAAGRRTTVAVGVNYETAFAADSKLCRASEGAGATVFVVRVLPAVAGGRAAVRLSVDRLDLADGEALRGGKGVSLVALAPHHARDVCGGGLQVAALLRVPLAADDACPPVHLLRLALQTRELCIPRVSTADGGGASAPRRRAAGTYPAGWAVRCVHPGTRAVLSLAVEFGGGAAAAGATGGEDLVLAAGPQRAEVYSGKGLECVAEMASLGGGGGEVGEVGGFGTPVAVVRLPGVGGQARHAHYGVVADSGAVLLLTLSEGLTSFDKRPRRYVAAEMTKVLVPPRAGGGGGGGSFYDSAAVFASASALLCYGRAGGLRAVATPSAGGGQMRGLESRRARCLSRGAAAVLDAVWVPGDTQAEAELAVAAPTGGVAAPTAPESCYRGCARVVVVADSDDCDGGDGGETEAATVEVRQRALRLSAVDGFTEPAPLPGKACLHRTPRGNVLLAYEAGASFLAVGALSFSSHPLLETAVVYAVHACATAGPTALFLVAADTGVMLFSEDDDGTPVLVEHLTSAALFAQDDGGHGPGATQAACGAGVPGQPAVVLGHAGCLTKVRVAAASRRLEAFWTHTVPAPRAQQPAEVCCVAAGLGAVYYASWTSQAVACVADDGGDAASAVVALCADAQALAVAEVCRAVVALTAEGTAVVLRGGGRTPLHAAHVVRLPEGCCAAWVRRGLSLFSFSDGGGGDPFVYVWLGTSALRVGMQACEVVAVSSFAQDGGSGSGGGGARVESCCVLQACGSRAASALWVEASTRVGARAAVLYVGEVEAEAVRATRVDVGDAGWRAQRVAHAGAGLLAAGGATASRDGLFVSVFRVGGGDGGPLQRVVVPDLKDARLHALRAVPCAAAHGAAADPEAPSFRLHAVFSSAAPACGGCFYLVWEVYVSFLGADAPPPVRIVPVAAHPLGFRPPTPCAPSLVVDGGGGGGGFAVASCHRGAAETGVLHCVGVAAAARFLRLAAPVASLAWDGGGRGGGGRPVVCAATLDGSVELLVVGASGDVLRASRCRTPLQYRLLRLSGRCGSGDAAAVAAVCERRGRGGVVGGVCVVPLCVECVSAPGGAGAAESGSDSEGEGSCGRVQGVAWHSRRVAKEEGVLRLRFGGPTGDVVSVSCAAPVNESVLIVGGRDGLAAVTLEMCSL